MFVVLAGIPYQVYLGRFDVDQSLKPGVSRSHQPLNVIEKITKRDMDRLVHSAIFNPVTRHSRHPGDGEDLRSVLGFSFRRAIYVTVLGIT